MTMKLSLKKPVIRNKKNPILTCHDVNKAWKEPHLQTITCHNAGAAIYNKEVLLLFRSHLRSGISVLGIARSRNGLDNWKVDEKPALIPCNEKDDFAERTNIGQLIENEQGGIEDARISKIDNTYLITYSAYHGTIAHRVRVSLATTTDFKKFKRYGPVLQTDMRNVVIFPEKINHQFYGLFRPNDETQGHVGGIYKQILIGKTNDWKQLHWDINRQPVMMQKDGPSAFQDKIGPGATPLKTRHGWINIFHGVRNTMDGNPYVLGVALHDLNDPEKVIVSNIPVLFPSKADCKVKKTDYVHVPNVVFSCGAIRKDNGEIYIYYGGNDTVMNVAMTHEDILADLCHKFPQNPLDGTAMYQL